MTNLTRAQQDRITDWAFKLTDATAVSDTDYRMLARIIDDICEHRSRVGREAARVSRLLFEAREEVALLGSIIQTRGRYPIHELALAGEIDAYREEKGWNPDGYGDEADRNGVGGAEHAEQG